MAIYIYSYIEYLARAQRPLSRSACPALRQKQKTSEGAKKKNERGDMMRLVLQKSLSRSACPALRQKKNALRQKKNERGDMMRLVLKSLCLVQHVLRTSWIKPLFYYFLFFYFTT